MSSPIEILLEQVNWELVNTDKEAHPNNLPFATHKGVLEIAGISLRCYRLNDGRAIFDADDVNTFLLDGLRIDA
jgi:hypothetical protein